MIHCQFSRFSFNRDRDDLAGLVAILDSEINSHKEQTETDDKDGTKEMETSESRVKRKCPTVPYSTKLICNGITLWFCVRLIQPW